MLDLLAKEPLQVVLLFLILSIATSFIFINLKNTKLLFFCLAAYIPFSFRTNSGSLAMYLIILLFFLILVVRDQAPSEQKGAIVVSAILAFLVFLTSQFSLFTTEHYGLVVRNLNNKIQLAPRYYLLLTMFSNFFIFLIAKKFVKTKEDLALVVKILVLSGGAVTLVGYLQIINRGLYFFKYIVIAESPKWATRVAGTMQGYETFAEYTGIMLVLSVGLFLVARRRVVKFLYLCLIFNFIVIMTLTQTRGIYVALGVAVAYLIILMWAIGRYRVSIGISIAAVSLVVMLAGSIILIDQFRPEHSFIKRFEDFERFDLKKKQFSTRTVAWANGIELISNMTPMEKIFGAGNKYLGQGERAREHINWPHCMYMSYILRNGYLGLAVFSVFILWLYGCSLRGIINNPDRELFIFSVCLHLALVIFIVHQAKIEFLRHDRTQNLYWLFFALLSTLPYIKQAAFRKQREAVP